MEDREEEARKANEDVELPESRLSDVFERTRDIISNVAPVGARESSGEERNASNVVPGSKSNVGNIEEPQPREDALRSKSARHVENARQSNRVVDELIREENEGLASSALEVEEELNEFLAYSEQDVSGELDWDYNPERSLETAEQEVDNLLSYLSERSGELEDVFEKIGHVDRSINSFRDDLKDVESRLGDKKAEQQEEGERVLVEKQDRMTPSEARNADIGDLLEFAEDVSGSKEADIQQSIDELVETKNELDRRVSSLEEVESTLYDARDDVIDEIESVYKPHAETMESVGHELVEQLEEDIGYLESLAAMEEPNLTEEQGTKHVDDAAGDLQKTREEAAYGLVERINEMAHSLGELMQEHDDLVDLLPEQYLEDGEFDRVDTSIEFMESLDERLAESYDSPADRVAEAYEEATGESLYDALDDADSTLAHLRATYADEVPE
ncbi:MAG: hypothetical protein ABEJ75_04340 [Candidatus Nanohaloarchaea archaeon]